VAWSDSIFDSSPDPTKLRLLARVAKSVYTGTLSHDLGSAISDPAHIASAPLLNAWTFRVDGELMLAIEGTSNNAQYADIVDGYPGAVPFFGGGFVNRFIAEQADLLWPLIPNAVRVFVGHSLGGAVAQLLARRAGLAGLPIAGSVSFGAPRFLSPPANTSSSWPSIVNVVQQLDPVPWSAPDGTAGRTWRSPGQQWTLHSNGFLEATNQQPISLVQWAAFLQHHGFAWHATDSYIANLQVALPPLPIGFIAGGSGAMDLYRVEVKGLLLGQACDNGFWYLNDNGLNPSLFIEDFRSEWRTWILPRLSPQYKVIHYDVGQLGGFVLQNPAATPLVSLPRYSEFARAVGTNSDVGTSSNADPMPSFVTVSAPKACSAWYLENTLTPAPLRKRPRGLISFGGIPRLNTRATTEGNVLLNAEITSWTAALDALRDLHINGHVTIMALVTQYGDIVPPATVRPVLFNAADPPEPTYNVSFVRSLTPNVFVGSRISRKQTLSTRG